MKRHTIIVTAIAAIAGLAWSGLHIAHSVKCRSLEGDYLNSVAVLKGNVSIALIANDARLSADLERMNERELKNIEASLGQVFSECGARAGRTAARKGTEILF